MQEMLEFMKLYTQQAYPLPFKVREDRPIIKVDNQLRHEGIWVSMTKISIVLHIIRLYDTVLDIWIISTLNLFQMTQKLNIYNSICIKHNFFFFWNLKISTTIKLLNSPLLEDVK